MRPDPHARHRRRPADPLRRPGDGWRALGRDRFERLVDDAVADLPDFALEHLGNVAIIVEDVPPDDEVLLGVYDGVPRPARGGYEPLLPDRITIYRRPHERRSATRAELRALLTETLVHEIAHHVGIDDDRLDELGWG